MGLVQGSKVPEFQVPGSRFQVPGSRFQVPKIIKAGRTFRKVSILRGPF
jgi:hypothetical protein